MQTVLRDRAKTNRYQSDTDQGNFREGAPNITIIFDVDIVD